jgi:hypothetical protein
MQERRGLIILDTFAVHKTDTTVAAMAAINCDVIFILGGLTPILQPLDISVNKPMKDYIWDAYSRWARNTFDLEKGLAKPRRKEVAEWLFVAWESLSADTIKNGFRFAGLHL